MVATDSYRLAVKRTELENELGGEIEANIPARALRELARILSSEGAEEAAISLLTNQAVFEAGGVTLTTRLIEGQFPNFRQLLPESYEHDVRLTRPDFLDVTRRVSQLAQRNAPLRLSFEPGQLTVADVILNRAHSGGRFPASICGVVRQAGQFSFVRGGVIPTPPAGSRDWRVAVAIAQIAMQDLADGGAPRALFFHARSVRPGWRLTRVAAIGNHVFYR